MFALICIQGNTYIIEPQKNAVLHNSKGLAYMQDGYYYQAAYEFKLAILLSNNTAATASFYNNLGVVYQRAQKYDWALGCYKKAIQMNPNFLEYYQNLIKIYKEEGLITRVIARYSKATQSSGSSSKTWLILGLAYLEANKYDKGIACLKKFREIEPNLLLTDGVNNLLNQYK